MQTKRSEHTTSIETPTYSNNYLEKVTKTVVNTMGEVATVVADTTKIVSETVTEAVGNSVLVEPVSRGWCCVALTN